MSEARDVTGKEQRIVWFWPVFGGTISYSATCGKQCWDVLYRVVIPIIVLYNVVDERVISRGVFCRKMIVLQSKIWSRQILALTTQSSALSQSHHTSHSPSIVTS